MVRFFCDHYGEAGSRPGRQHPHVAVSIDADDLIAESLRGLGITTAADLDRLLAARRSPCSKKACSVTPRARRRAPVDHDGNALTAASLARLFTEGTLVHRLSDG